MTLPTKDMELSFGRRCSRCAISSTFWSGQLGKPRRRPGDTLVLAALSRVLVGSGQRSLLPSPETLLRWHRELVWRKRAAYLKRPRRVRKSQVERDEFIVRLAHPRWGYRRIEGELLKLGYRCSYMTVRTVLVVTASSRHRVVATDHGESSSASTRASSWPTSSRWRQCG